MSAKWPSSLLKDVCSQSNNLYSKKDGWGFANYLDTGNITENRIENIQSFDLNVAKLPSRARKKIQQNDVLFSLVRPNMKHCGIIRNILPNMLVSTGFAVLRGKENILDNAYLYYYLCQDQIVEQLQSIAEDNASTYPALRPSDLSNLTITLPPINTQRKISDFLLTFDDKIEINKKIIDNLDRQISLIFTKTFLNGKKKDIPLSDLVEKSISGDWGKDSPQNNYNKKVLCIRGADIHQIKSGFISKIPTRYILTKNFESKKLLPGNLIIEISGGSPTQSTGRSILLEESFVSRLNGNIICTNFCKSLKIKQNFNYFFYSYWNYLYSKGIFFNFENGTTGIKNLDLKSILTHITFPEPSSQDLELFNVLCSKFMNMRDTLSYEISILSDMRDALISKLISH